MKMKCLNCGGSFDEQDRLVVDNGEEDMELCPYCKSENIEVDEEQDERVPDDIQEMVYSYRNIAGADHEI